MLGKKRGDASFSLSRTFWCHPVGCGHWYSTVSPQLDDVFIHRDLYSGEQLKKNWCLAQGGRLEVISMWCRLKNMAVSTPKRQRLKAYEKPQGGDGMVEKCREQKGNSAWRTGLHQLQLQRFYEDNSDNASEKRLAISQGEPTIYIIPRYGWKTWWVWHGSALERRSVLSPLLSQRTVVVGIVLTGSLFIASEQGGRTGLWETWYSSRMGNSCGWMDIKGHSRQKPHPRWWESDTIL